MTTKCEIRYSGDQKAIFFGGSTITGTVELTLLKPKRFISLQLKLKGYAQVRWTEGSGKSSTTFVGRQEYYKRQITLISGTGAEKSLKPGVYKFDFTHQLDKDLPASFEHDDGFIRYTAKVVLVRHWKNQSFKFGMTVLNKLDLNHHQALKEAVRYGNTKNFNNSFLARGAINFDVEVPMTGYVPGQAIPVRVNVHNDSDVDIAQISVKLKQIITFKTIIPRPKSKFLKREVYAGWLKSVSRNTSRTFDTVVPITSVPPTNRDLCNVIEYFYVLIVKPRLNLHSDESISIPITIGTVPFTDSIVPVASGGRSLTRVPSVPMFIAPPSMRRIESLPSYDDVLREHPELASIDPPSYEVSDLHGHAFTENHDDGPANYQHLFRPLYPVYHFNAVPIPSYRDSNNNHNNSPGHRGSNGTMGWHLPNSCSPVVGSPISSSPLPSAPSAKQM